MKGSEKCGPRENLGGLEQPLEEQQAFTAVWKACSPQRAEGTDHNTVPHSKQTTEPRTRLNQSNLAISEGF